jgi:hypothetical protein
MTQAQKFNVLKTTKRRDGSVLAMFHNGGSAVWTGPGELEEGERVLVVDGKVVRVR